MTQLVHAEHRFERKQFPITLVCDAIRTPENLGMIFRIADAFGIEKIILDQESPDPLDRSVKRIARNTNKIITYEISEDVELEVKKLAECGYHIIGLEITSDSEPIHRIQLGGGKTALIVGAERNGISKELLQLCSKKFHIPMYGNNSSMNVANALSVALYEITNKFNKD